MNFFLSSMLSYQQHLEAINSDPLHSKPTRQIRFAKQTSQRTKRHVKSGKINLKVTFIASWAVGECVFGCWNTLLCHSHSSRLSWSQKSGISPCKLAINHLHLKLSCSLFCYIYWWDLIVMRCLLRSISPLYALLSIRSFLFSYWLCSCCWYQIPPRLSGSNA